MEVLAEIINCALLRAGIQPQDKLLVACSGGSDSMALAHALVGLGVEVCIGHVSHGIRPSAPDEAFVRQWCAQYRLPFFLERVDVPAAAHTQHRSLEDTARQMRYEALERMRMDAQCRWILTAHHAEDQTETVLMHILNGSGLTGLCGIRIQQQRILRPMLDCRKRQILSYCQTHNLPFCTDETNLDQRFVRNHIRNDLMPFLQRQYQPQLVRQLCALARTAVIEQDYWDDIAARWMKSHASVGCESLSLDLQAFLQLHQAARRRVLHHCLFMLGIMPSQQAVDALDILAGKPGSDRRINLSRGFEARKRYHTLDIGFLSADGPAEGEQPFEIGKRIEMGSWHIDCQAADCPQDPRHGHPDIHYLDLDALPADCQWRLFQAGDRFYPLGAPGSRLLSDLFTDKKIDVYLRKTLPLLASGIQVLWVAQIGMAQTARITSDTKRVMRITCTNVEKED